MDTIGVMIDSVTYNCAEHYLTASKAKLYSNESSRIAIMHTHNPRTHELLGRGVSDLDHAAREQHCESIVLQETYEFFSLNAHTRQSLSITRSKHLAEASRFDCIWGIPPSQRLRIRDFCSMAL